ncbi:hypothetical protein A2303_07340 [Candidatus Falkowbacteria bacterium RIFOXYB2_FULL_47_14]|uniref:Nucleoside 2-deoxyribosyltransferase n=1 Tax=Candidatus Falkowbacteria bacterium RIFOXYA2_FULL_47_19 TaxID=1797994 RepID=A0A1F5SGI8_9BACT|nr:MAG: hypothetical protein A2227_01090 [Candidatus Falkowbacteria bacterium RIFOXYA2_FULL_47_19]OGF34960.1 MAG: hypothetical protein A2468_07045 [Candidatus Falkowbacteria bacterium RIFOXYC2_FULL_46_15]OGF43675.1 MAG: hypothetical protein A2303_07340 [Candidatus Falkowbacteria bacterium RIFOXYB2_FULL_47_14]
MKKIFVICPVRDADKDTSAKINDYIDGLEQKGYRAHWPPRDTDQTDPIGDRICRDNLNAILACDEIHIWYDPSSTGSHFDLGGAFMLIELLGYKKKIVLINNGAKVVPGKGFMNVIRYLAEKTKDL